MKKQILCALSVAALAATMLTVPVYAADTIRVEGESWGSDQNWNVHSTDVTPNIWAPPAPGPSGLNLTSKTNSKTVNFDEGDKPYASYTFNVDKAGIYDLEYVANYLEDKNNAKLYMSPFSVTLNDDQIMFTGDTPNNSAMTAYEPLSGDRSNYGKYNVPVYLEAGENTITFTVEGGRYSGSKDYVFYLDYFQFIYDEEATTSGIIQVEAEELIAGNVPNSGVEQINSNGDTAAKEAAPFASKQTMYRFNNGQNTGGYLEYIVPSAKDGDFNLEITGSNARNTPTLNAWCGDFDVVVGDTRISVGENVTSDHKAAIYDIMTAKQTVKLKQGLNKIRVELDEKDINNSRYLIHLDYLKFTPVEEEPEPEKVQTIDPFSSYDKETKTAEFTAEGLSLGDLSKLVFGFTKEGNTTYKYYPEQIIASGNGSANIAVRLTGIEGDPDDVKLAVSDSNLLTTEE